MGLLKILAKKKYDSGERKIIRYLNRAEEIFEEKKDSDSFEMIFKRVQLMFKEYEGEYKQFFKGKIEKLKSRNKMDWGYLEHRGE